MFMAVGITYVAIQGKILGKFAGRISMKPQLMAVTTLMLLFGNLFLHLLATNLQVVPTIGTDGSDLLLFVLHSAFLA